MYDMINKTIFIIFLLALTNIAVLSQWIQQHNIGTPLYNVDFVNQNTGWVTGNNSVILKTTNGGLNWISQTIDLVYPKSLYGLDMLDANTGYIVGWFETILKTTNGGQNWNIISNVPSNNGNSNNACSFINVQTGWICSALGRVLRTTNGGFSWDTSFAINILRDIQFLNAQTGWVCGDGGTLFKSTNGGLNWIDHSNISNSDLDLFFLNPNTGWVVGEQSNHIFKTTNGGSNWDTIAQLPGGSLMYSYCVYFASPQVGYVGGTYTRLFKSVNGGFNWGRDVLSDLGFINNFSFLNDTLGWAVAGGTIIHTINGGSIVKVEQIGTQLPLAFELFQNYPNPFNPATVIRFNITNRTHARIRIFDIQGKEFNVLVNQLVNPGSYQIVWNAGNNPSGIYFYRIETEYFAETKKMVLIK